MKILAQLLLFCLLINSCKTSNVLNLVVKNQNGDVTEILQNSFDELQDGQELIINKGSYKISKSLFLKNRKGIKIHGEGVVLKMTDYTLVKNGFSMLLLDNVEDLKISGIVLDANRENRLCAEVPAHTLIIRSGENITLESVTCRNNVVDGIYIGASDELNEQTYPTNVSILNCVSINSFRNALSLINGNSIKIFGGQFSGSKGTNPESGIDLESNLDTKWVGIKNIEIQNVSCSNNNGWGIIVSQMGSPEFITIKESIVKNNYGGILCASSESLIMKNSVSNSEIGIESIRYDGEQIDRNVIQENIISNTKTAIKYLGLEGQIKGNKIYNCEIGIELNGNSKDHTQVEVLNNEIVDYTNLGIYGKNFKEVVIENNKVVGQGNEGARLYNGKHRVFKNQFAGKIGIHAANSNCDIQNNIFNSNDRDIYIRDSGVDVSKGSLKNNRTLSERQLKVDNKSKLVKQID